MGISEVDEVVATSVRFAAGGVVAVALCRAPRIQRIALRAI